jgi:molybdopterin molybdotransferase
MNFLEECSWDHARKITEISFSFSATKSLAIAEANGRYLAQSVKALTDLPAYPTSAMDGWAICQQGPWKIVGEVRTGFISGIKLKPGECIKISTGGVVPEGATAILPWEQASECQGAITGVLTPADHIRPAGAEAKKGEIILKAGTKITPPVIGLLAGCGHDEVIVAKQPRVAIFFLGDELLHSGLPTNGAVRDALGCQLPSLLEMYGAKIITAKFLKDELEFLTEAISTVLNDVDLIITTGGTADGPKDFVKPAITHFSGEYLIDRVRVRPGYHILLAKLNNSIPLLALPGNPQSAVAALTAFGEPLVNALQGAPVKKIEKVKLSQPLNTPKDSWRMVPGSLTSQGFEVAQYLGSNMLRGLAYSQGFALLDPGEHQVNQLVRWLPLPA